MKVSQKVIGGVAVLSVGVLALGACSSNASEQPQQSPDQSREASPSADNMEIIQATTAGPFSEVAFTHNSEAKCTRKDSNTELVINCTDVGQNFIGDPVYVRVPTNDFVIKVVNTRAGHTRMKSILRNWQNFDLEESADNEKTWNHPKKTKDNAWGWAVGVQSDEPMWDIGVTITVTKA